MRISSRRGTIVFFLCLGVGLVALAVALNVGWIILNWREGVLLFFGIVFFALMIAGMVVNTIFLVRELRRSEQHDSFINAVTHELKTPVASIRLHLETLQRRELPEPQKQDFYRVMLSDTDRLTETVEQVLRAGRAGDKKTGREKAEVDFRQVVRECMDATRSRHHLQPEALRFQEASNNGDGLRVRGSAEDLRTAVFNVLDNAVKYSGDNVDVRVQLETPDEKRIVLRVQDQGVGIPPDDMKRIFKRFYRVPHRSLAHVKGNRARALYCEGDRAQARRQRVCRERRRRAGNNDCAGTAEVDGMSRVLVVEDEAHLAQGLRFNLEAEGYAAEVVGDGESATDRLLEKKENFDAVVLDIMLPGKDGFSVVSELRAARNYIPVLMLTARGRPEDVLKGFASGADDYLAKPFDLSILLARLQGLLRRSRWMRGGPTPAPPRARSRCHRRRRFGTFSFGGKTIDFGALELRSGENTIHLTLMESELLRHLVRNDGRIVSRKQILEEVWGLHEDTDTRAIDNFVVRLRRYIERRSGESAALTHGTRRGISVRS